MENDRGDIITVRRGVKTTADTRLVTVFSGPLLSHPSGRFEQRDFFVLDPGAAQRESGFHRMFADFVGWDLPKARRFDGRETTLYMETIFPLLYVEQKAGWSSIPAAFPNYLQIRDVGRRAVEFLIGLDTYDLELRRQKLDLDQAENNSAWAAKRGEVQAVAAQANARVQGEYADGRLRLEARLRALEDVQQRFEQHKASLLDLARRHADILAARESLPKDQLSAEDRAKLDRLTVLIREQAASYGFSTFPAAEIDLAPENFRPQKEGFEIGFELSASDAIRLKWAYHLSLMELSKTYATNHPGFVVFDEPRQQATREISFQQLLQRAAESKKSGQQVIFATSERQERLAEFLAGVDCAFLPFDGCIVKRLAT